MIENLHRPKNIHFYESLNQHEIHSLVMIYGTGNSLVKWYHTSIIREEVSI